MVEKVISLPQAEYEYFSRHLLKDYDFIKENKGLMHQMDGKMHCLLVIGDGGTEGVLVESEGADYARYSSFLPDASVFIQDMNPYISLTRLENKLKEIVDYIIKDGCENTRSGNYNMFFDSLSEKYPKAFDYKEILADMIEEREEVADVQLVDGAFDVMYCLAYCPNYDKTQELGYDPDKEEAEVVQSM